MQMQKYVAELIGTFLLVFLGTSAIVGFGGAFDATGAPTVGFLGIALTFGLTLAVLAYTLGPVSGGHFNPAVTIALTAARRFNARDAGPYIVVQIIGAILASAVLYFIASGTGVWTPASGLGQTTFAATMSIPAAVLAEVVLTFVLVWTILTVTERSFATPAFAGLAIGLALAVIHFAGIAFTGASVNPARSIGPAVFIGQVAPLAISQLWVYLVAPIVGGLLATGAYTALGMASAAPTEETTTTRARA